jgi:hypothetical protein
MPARKFARQGKSQTYISINKNLQTCLNSQLKLVLMSIGFLQVLRTLTKVSYPEIRLDDPSRNM